MKQRKTAHIPPATVALFCVLGLVALTILVVDVGMYGGSALSKDGQQLPANPMSAPFELPAGRAHWSSTSTTAVLALFGPVLLLVAVVVVIKVKRSGGKSRVDYKAQLMGTGKEIKALTARTARKTAKRCGR